MITVKKIKRERIATAIIDLSNQSNIYALHSGHSPSQLQGVWLQAGQLLSLSPQLGCVHLLLSTPHSHKSDIMRSPMLLL